MEVKMRKARTTEQISAIKANCEAMLANLKEGETNLPIGKTYKGKTLMVLSANDGSKVFHDGENVLGLKEPDKKNAIWLGNVPLAERLLYKDYLVPRTRKSGKPKKEKVKKQNDEVKPEKTHRKRGRPKKVVVENQTPAE